jgi:23S rRNA pseudouridine955/2504/2580 synthase
MRHSFAGRELIAGPDDAYRRLDKVLRVVLKDRALSEIYAALRKGRIRVNDLKAEPELRLQEGDRIFLHASLELNDGPLPVDITDEDIGQIADILILATRDLLFVNKARGELSQGPGGLEPKIRQALAGRSAASLSFVPGPLHRLDRNTTGILTFPRNAAGARAFTALIRERRIIKRYLALVDGEASKPDEWRDTISRDAISMTSAVSDEGDEAYAKMRPLLAYGGRSLILVELHTGLTHQIRVQASSRGLPLSGDSKYHGELFHDGYILHALSLEFPEPPFADVPRFVTAPFPENARARLASLFGEEALRSAVEQALEG